MPLFLSYILQKLNPYLFSYLNFAKNEILVLSKKHLLKEMTTKKLYHGKQAVQIVVNGLAVTDKFFFNLNIE